MSKKQYLWLNANDPNLAEFLAKLESSVKINRVDKTGESGITKHLPGGAIHGEKYFKYKIEL